MPSCLATGKIHVKGDWQKARKKAYNCWLTNTFFSEVKLAIETDAL